MKTISKILVFAILGSAVNIHAATDTDKNNHEESNFNDGSLEPFKVCTTRGGNYVRIVNKRAKCQWDEAEHRDRNTRSFRGAEFCAERAKGREQIFTGFRLYIPSATANLSWPDDKDTIVWQNFMLGGCSSWGAVLHITDNDLWVYHRNFCTPDPTTKKIYSNLPRKTWINFQTHTKVSKNEKGFIHIRADGERLYLKTNINHGFGASWTNNNKLGSDSYQEQKFGIYAFDTSNHTRNEVRTIYYDNCSVFRTGGSDTGWDKVDPS
ncbi:polysaccharide lyase [Verrucomicrobiales bacterium]|nr:polysaccharide lyase [Verrucomicrobiales bacterium]